MQAVPDGFEPLPEPYVVNKSVVGRQILTFFDPLGWTLGKISLFRSGSRKRIQHNCDVLYFEDNVTRYTDLVPERYYRACQRATPAVPGAWVALDVRSSSSKSSSSAAAAPGASAAAGMDD